MKPVFDGKKNPLVRDQIREAMTCYQYCKEFGIELHGNKFKSVVDPGRSNTTASLDPNTDFKKWSDWKGDLRHGDVIQLCMWHQFHENTPQAYGKALKLLASHLGIPMNSKKYDKAVETFQAKLKQYHNNIDEYVYSYLEKRGFSREYINERQIGKFKQSNNINYSNRIVFPYEDENGNFVYYITRRDPIIDDNMKKYPNDSEMYKTFDATDKYRKAQISEANNHIIWGLHTLKGERKHDDLLILAEGIIDAMSWDFQGYHVVSACTGPFNKDQETNFFYIVKRFKKVLLTFDNDLKGTDFTNRMMQKLFDRNIPFDVAVIPSLDGKDVNDYFVVHKELESLISNAKSGLSVLVNSYKSFDELEKVLYQRARFMSDAEIDSTVNYIDFAKYSLNMGTRDINNFKNSLKKAPTEMTIIEDIRERYNLIYVDNDGFYLYQHGVWTKQSDNIIKGIIGKRLGKKYNTSQKKNAICNSMTSELLQSVEFNKSNVITFLNGTLDLEKDDFRKSSPSDYCTIQLQYSYKPYSKNEAFIQFIEDITQGEPSRIKLLQEIGGDVLNTENTYEKAFFFCGSGANGKSIYADTLRLVYGIDNVSAVKLHTLEKPFHAINLKDSLVNIDEEVKFKEVRGNEKRLIELASKTTQIEDSYKGKDRIKFRPRCTQIYFLNEMMETTDCTDALGRRLVFIKLPLRYFQIDEIKPGYTLKENEREANPYIFDRIKPNPSGVFNWFYEGYKRVKEQKGFTRCVDQEEMFRNWQKANNTIAMFVEFCREPIDGLKTKNNTWSYLNTQMIEKIMNEKNGSIGYGDALDMVFDLHAIFGAVSEIPRENLRKIKIDRAKMFYLYAVWCDCCKYGKTTPKKFTEKFRKLAEGLVSETEANGTRYYIAKT